MYIMGGIDCTTADNRGYRLIPRERKTSYSKVFESLRTTTSVLSRL